MEPFLAHSTQFLPSNYALFIVPYERVAHFARNWPGSRASDGWSTTYYIMAKALSAPEYQQLHAAIESALITAGPYWYRAALARAAEILERPASPARDITVAPGVWRPHRRHI